MKRHVIIVCLLIILILVITGCEDKDIILEEDWAIIETDHFLYFYIEEDEFNSIAAHNAAIRLERFYELTAPVWKFSPDSKIKYYKFKDQEQKERLTSMTGTGKAFLTENTVHSIYASDAHEVSHLITTQHILETTGNIKIANFWLEGIAMYYTWPSVYFNENNELKPTVGYWHGQNVHNHLRKNYLDDDNLSDLSPFIYNNDSFNDLDDDLSYPLAGSFVTYLLGKNHNDIEKLNKFREYLRELNQCESQSQALKKFEDIFNKSFLEQNSEWVDFLSAARYEFVS